MTLRTALLAGFTLLFSSALAQRTPVELADALQRAARAGNAAAYRALLAPGGTFTVEGANFAADLARWTPHDVTYALGDLHEQGTRADAQLTLAWTAPTGQKSHVTLPVRLERTGDAWRYAGEAFEPLNTPAGTLLALRVPGLPERAAPLAPLLARAARQVRNVLGLDVPTNAVVKIYATRAQLSASVALSLPAVAGWYEPGEAIKLALPPGDSSALEQETLRVLTHEFTHMAVGMAAGADRDKRIPWWLHEGLAEFTAWHGNLSVRRARITGYARSGWVPLTELKNFPSVPLEHWGNAYNQGLGVVEFLADRDRKHPWQLARAFAETDDADAAALATGFASFAALEEAARAWLAAR